MAWTQSDLDKIDTNIATGIRRVTYEDGRTVEYQSLDHMIAARKVIAAQLEVEAQVVAGIPRRRVASFRSGY